jgi:hypothetical protein
MDGRTYMLVRQRLLIRAERSRATAPVTRAMTADRIDIDLCADLRRMYGELEACGRGQDGPRPSASPPARPGSDS